MSLPTEPTRRTARGRARLLLLAFILGLTALSAVGLILIRAGTIPPLAGFIGFTAAELILGVTVLARMLRHAAVQDSTVATAQAAQQSMVATLRHQAASLQDEVTARARELETANASLRVAAQVNALLALCAQHMPNAVLITDAGGTVLWANLAWEKISGRSAAEAVRQPVAEYLGQVWEGFDAGRGALVLRSGEPGALETRGRAHDGSSQWLTIAFQPVRGTDHGVVNFIVLIEDFTARREADLRLQSANERLQFALHASGYGIWETHLPDGRIEWDDRMYEIYGLDPAQFDGSLESWYRLVHPKDVEALRAHRQQVMDGVVKHYEIDFWIVRPDGKVRAIEARGFVLRDPAGVPLRFVGLNRDITAPKELEERLRHSEEIAIQVSRLAQIGAWELQLANRTLRWEPELFRISEVELGYEPTLDKMTEFFPNEHRELFSQAVELAITEGRSFDLECPFETALGRRRWVHVFGRAEFKDGQAVRLFGAVQEITARHEAEDAQRKLEIQLFQVQKMETLGTLAGGIAHDFNNLLTGIIGYQDLALDSLDSDHPSRHCLAEARQASVRACELVEQILVFSRQTGGSERVSIDVASVIEEARRFLRATVPATIQIEVTIAPRCGRVLADAAQLNQILLNLGSNAAHAMRGGGILSLSLAPVHLSATQAAAHGNLPAGAYVHLMVSDTGHGMNAETQKRIFDPFFTTKSVGEGTGLGLAIVHGIVRAHGGAIEVSSAPGVGTTFFIYLPVAGAEHGEQAPTSSPPPRGAGEVICVVDDEQLVAQATRLTLDRFGYSTIVFNSSEECLKALRQEPDGCALLLSDQTMPGMTGMDLSAKVRSFAPRMPILIMSGYFSKVSAGALEQIGNIALVAKPFTADEIARKVHQALHPSGQPAPAAEPGALLPPAG